ncbi:MAG: N-6 DNA methylase [Candidatus Desulfofervidaceae bacterium]|nr:N-6 DNA methylase [Candidatus Desulfofervidaceae bacterium]
MENLTDIQYWRNQLGLLPINLFSNNVNEFILLNGGYGDFCIDFNLGKHPDIYFSNAWSSNTKNFIALSKNKVFLYNWLKGKEESYDKKLISENLEKFYQYLLRNSYKSEYDIVPFVIDIYKRLRNLTKEKEQGVIALNYLFLLMAAYEEKKSFNNIDFQKWQISNNIQIPPNLDRYLDEFSRGIQYKKRLKPNIELIIRHSAGELFQEAQKEAIFFNRGMNLFGLYDSNYNTNKQLFSSFHYTPSYLARTIVEYSLSKINLQTTQNLKILDPACGSSEFLLEVLKQLKTQGYTGNVEIYGWDSSGSAISISKFLLSYEKREWGDKLSLNIELVEDSLIKNWDSDYDLIIMNPPFLSWELMDKTTREIVSETLGNLAKQKPNLASAFIYKSIKHLKPGGIIGTVMPTSILLMDSYKKLRNEIKENISLLLVGKLGNFIFEYALTDVSILIGKKTKSNDVPLLLWTKNEKAIVNEAFRDLRKVNYNLIPYVTEKKTYSIYKPEIYPFNKENWKILSYREQELIKHFKLLISTKQLVTIQDIFDVKQGVRTGNNKVFKISKDFYTSLPKQEQKFFRPAIDNDSIKKGQIIEYDYLWYPYNENGVTIKTEQELQEKAPSFFQRILLPNKEKLIKRARKDESNWWLLSEHRAWLRHKYPKLVSTEFGKAGSFAFDDKGEFVIERGNGWIPKKEFKNKDYNYFYLSIFSSLFFNTLLSIYSKELLKGWDLGKKYTKNIPIPEINEEFENSFVYEKLVYFGKLISKGKFYNVDIIDNYLKRYIYKTDI